MQQKQNEQEQFKIPQTIQAHKRQVLMYKILSTLTGLDNNQFSIKMVLLWLKVIAVFLIMKFVPNPQFVYGARVGINAGVCFLVSIGYRFYSGMDIGIIHRSIISGIFGYLWSHQLYYSHQPQLIVLSLISIITSIGPILFTAIPQYTSPTLYINELNVHSVLYVRLLLPLPLFIIQLILDYGAFFSESTHHLYYIRLTISLVFLLWTFGWISTVYNTYFFVINNFNKFLFGDQTKANFKILIISFILNCIPIAIYLGWAQNSYLPFWILWIGSTITSIVSFLISYFLNDKFNNLTFNLRSISMIILQAHICGGLVALMLCVDFGEIGSISIKIITIIDVAFYVTFGIIKFLSLPRNFLGFSINIAILNNQYLRAIQRIVLRISAGFTVIILIQNLNILQLWMKLYQTLQVDVDGKFIQYFFVPFLVYRSYKRSISESTSFSFHLSVLISLGLIFVDRQLQSILVVLFFPPFPHNFIMTIIAPFTTPKKLSHKFQVFYQLIYLCITIFSIMIFVLFIGILQFTMVFGLPMFMCVIPTINEGNKIKSKQHSLYEKIVEYIPLELFRFQSQGFFLLRISKYIILGEIKQQLYGFGETIDIKGLQVQQVTSCHSKEGQTIDKMVQQTWGDNIEIFNTNNLWTVLSPLKKSVIYVPTQNQIQLTGIIESKQFVDLFKEGALKALVYEISKTKYSEKQLEDGEQIISDFSPICKKQKFESIFPLQFSKKIGLQVQYPQGTILNNQNKKKLPPIKNKKQVVNDFLDLLDSSPNYKTVLKGQTSTHQLMSGNNSQKKVEQEVKENYKLQKLNETSSLKINIKELNACLIMTLYHYSVGKFDYLNIKKVYDLINMEKGELSQVRFQKSQSILSRSLSKAFKIAVDKITMGETDIQLTDFQEYQKTSFLGTTGSQDYNNAVAKDTEDIWTLKYSKGQLSVKRLSKAQNQLYMFKADACIVKSIWNNLRFELMYATNDNDERYSIQTHPYLMRNLWTQACQQPFGYPSYHSGNIIIT